MRFIAWIPILAVAAQDAPPPAPVQDPPSAERLLLDATKKLESGGDPAELLDRAVAAFDEILKADPAKVDALAGRGEAKLRRGQAAEARGEDPDRSFAEALADFQKAVELDPKCVAALAGRGEVTAVMVHGRRQRGEDVSRNALDPALESLTKAVELDPARAASFAGRAFAGQQFALMRFQQYRAFDAAYPRAIEDFDRAVELEADRGWRWFQRGEARFLLAVHLGYRREDAREVYKKAAEDYRRALKLEPGLEALIRPHLRASEVNAEGGPPAPDARPGRHIAWARSWELAQRESKARNVPVWIYISGGAG